MYSIKFRGEVMISAYLRRSYKTKDIANAERSQMCSIKFQGEVIISASRVNVLVSKLPLKKIGSSIKRISLHDKVCTPVQRVLHYAA